MPPLNARQKVLIFLRSHRGVTANEVARALRVTSANARHHLSILVKDGRAEVLGFRRSLGQGRPLKIYGAVEVDAGELLVGLADALLANWIESVPVDGRDRLLEQLAVSLAGSGAPDAKAHISRRLANAVERLNQLHYQARWEAHAQGPRVVFGQCPYAAILQRHPELCRMDAFLLQALLSAPVRQMAKLERSVSGLPFCLFIVKE